LVFFATFAKSFANFAVKIFNRKGRKNSRKGAKTRAIVMPDPSSFSSGLLY
jgi:hypothetical protein